ncbi:TRAFs-binding domain-containing protein [Roseivirga sp.]|uniref:TRAFs-binding domain-containing protein n=1 Tax=Roseivirga sp. TaxID=1964215 RepID=UPI003B51CDE0
MKKLFLTVALSLFVVGAFAQKKVLRDADKAFRKGEMESAIELATQATQDPETGVEPDVYILLGKIYLQQFVDSGKSDAEAAAKSLEWFKKSMDKGDEKTQEKTKETLFEQPFFNPADNTKWIGGGETLALLDYYLVSAGNAALEEEDFAKAFAMLSISAEVENSIERDFFAGYAADNAEMDEEAYEFYNRVIGHEEEYDNKNYAYNSVIQYEIDNEDYDNALAHIREAQGNYPEEEMYKKWEVDVLIQSERMDEAISGLSKIIDAGQADKTTYYTLAYLQWNNEQLEDAEKNAKKALDLDANYAEALYVAGSVIFNQAAEIMKEANLTVDDDAKYNDLKEKAMARFKEAMPMFEKALEADPNDVYSLRPLSTIYDQLGMDAKRDAILDRLDALEDN